MMFAGLMPARSSGPPKPQGGPLSYLSTVTTASTSDWGSQSLDNLSKQPSDVASASSANPGASTPAADARATSSIATSIGQRGGGNGSGDSRRELGRKLSSADQSSADQGRASSRSSRASAEASDAVSVSNISRAQQADLYSKPLSTASEAQVRSEGSGSAAVRPDGLKQIPSAGPSDSQSQRQGPNADSATISNTAAADWSAFGGAAANEADSHQPQHATISQTASAHQSGHALLASSTSHVSAAQHGWSAFDQPSSASFDAAPSGMDDSAKEAAEESVGFDNSNPFLDPGQASRKQPVQAGVDFGSTNPFLEPGQDPWQPDTQAALADVAEAARMASGDSFGDFNAPGEREDDFEVAAWDAAAVPEDKTDRTAAVASADPFAASANFTDSAALLEPAQTDLLGGLDTMASVKALPQGPSPAQFGLSELQGEVDFGVQQGVQNSEQLQGRTLAKQASGVSFGCFEVSLACRQNLLLFGCCHHALFLSLCKASTISVSSS